MCTLYNYIYMPWFFICCLFIYVYMYRYLGCPNITKVYLEGVQSAIDNNPKGEPAGIKVHFKMDESGILQLDFVSISLSLSVKIHILTAWVHVTYICIAKCICTCVIIICLHFVDGIIVWISWCGRRIYFFQWEIQMCKLLLCTCAFI